MASRYPGSLHNHSDFSNLRLRDAISIHEELIDRAIELGHDVIAITEHESVSNAIKVEKYANKVKDKIKVIRGNEIYLCRDGLTGETYVKGQDKFFHFILLAKDSVGHQQIREISTRAWLRSWKQGKMIRVPTYYQDLLDIIGAAPGHVIGSTACLGGFLGTKLLQWHTTGRSSVFYNKICNWLAQIEQIFGKGNFYLELQPSDNDEQVFVNKEILKISEKLNIPYIITTDSHYTTKGDKEIHKAFLNAQEGEREVDAFYATTYLMDTQELEGYLRYMTREQLDAAYQSIDEIKDKCEEYSLRRPLKIPSLSWKSPARRQAQTLWIDKIPNLRKFFNSDFNGDVRMAELLVDKLASDPRLQTQQSYDELNKNLEETWVSSEVNKAHWSAYFLNLQNILDECWKAGTLVGPGRGSGVGFYLLYLLDLIQINPLWETTATYSWRFLNPSRVSVLDIDTDIEGGRRSEVLAHLRKVYGSDRMANVITFGTEGSKSAVQTAARGLGIDNDIALYISSLIPSDRGKTRTLDQCYYGDVEEGFVPIPLFVQQMNEYPELWTTAKRIEGLVCRMGEHAGGVIFVDEPFTNSTSLMKVPNGDTVTAFDLHDSEEASLIKIDLLSVEALDKMHACIDLLCEYGYMDQKPTLRETYEENLNIYKLERDALDMWKMVWHHEIQALFQMEQQSGIQGIALTKPENVDDLAVLNSVIRLMAQEKDAEQPLEKYARFKNDINEWYREMNQYGLTEAEQKLLEPIVGGAYGICESQEKFMSLVQMPECGGHDLTWADKLRKAIAKKNPAGFVELEKDFFKTVEEKNLSRRFCNYVWNVLVSTSKGYGFNASHTLAYSLVALQEMNLAYKYPIIFWNCACLITDSGGSQQVEEDGGIYFDEVETEEIVDIYEEENFEEYEYEDAPDCKSKKKKARSTNYDKIATALGKMKQEGVIVNPPDINFSTYTFRPDVENNTIVYGLRGLVGVGEEVILDTIKNRPYSSPRDYYQKVKPKKGAMISLIKAGAFDKMMERKLCMGWFLWEVCDKKKRLTLQNMPGLIKYDLIPKEEEYIIARRVYEFNRYLKAICKFNSTHYKLDERALNFIIELGLEEMIVDGLIDIKLWTKKYEIWMDTFRNWIKENKDQILYDLNSTIFLEEWNKYASGSVASWEMKAMSYYYHDHELKHVNKEKYGISNYFDLPEIPEIDRTFYKAGRAINLFKLTKIVGTCIAKNKAKGLVTLLTPDGVVNVKFRKEYFAIFDKQLSVKNQETGKKRVIESSWFNRGNMIIVQGVRQGDMFLGKKYASSAMQHQLYKIVSVDKAGNIELQDERKEV